MPIVQYVKHQSCCFSQPHQQSKTHHFCNLGNHNRLKYYSHSHHNSRYNLDHHTHSKWLAANLAIVVALPLRPMSSPVSNRWDVDAASLGETKLKTKIESIVDWLLGQSRWCKYQVMWLLKSSNRIYQSARVNQVKTHQLRQFRVGGQFSFHWLSWIAGTRSVTYAMRKRTRDM